MNIWDRGSIQAEERGRSMPYPLEKGRGSNYLTLRQQTALILEEKGSLRPEKENAASCPVFWPEEMSQIVASAKLDEPHSRNTAESWADGAESRNGR